MRGRIGWDRDTRGEMWRAMLELPGVQGGRYPSLTLTIKASYMLPCYVVHHQYGEDSES